MSFDSRENATPYTRQEGDTLATIAQRESQAGNELTWQDLARFNFGTDDPDMVNECLRDELGCRKRDANNNFQIALDDEGRSELLIPQPFQRAGFATNQTHTLRVRTRDCPPQFIECCRVDGVTFAFDSSFVRPSVVGNLDRVEQVANDHPEAKIMIFGHTDKVGTDQYNKALSERRARSVYAFIINDADTWEELYQEENWGVSVIQETLKELGHDPGAIDGQMGPNTRAAMRSFLGLPEGAPVSNDAAFRRRLFLAYMTGIHDVELEPDRFMEPRHMGCGEFNPVLETEERHEPNRRVMFYLFHPERLPNLPCRAGDLGPCRHQMDPPTPRHEPSFKCSFYDSIAKKCPCEGGGPTDETANAHISVLLRSNSGAVALANKAYRVEVSGDSTLEGQTDDDGLIEHQDVSAGDYPLELEGEDTGTQVPTSPDGMERIPLRVVYHYLFEEVEGGGPDSADPDESFQGNELGEDDGSQDELNV